MFNVDIPTPRSPATCLCVSPRVSAIRIAFWRNSSVRFSPIVRLRWCSNAIKGAASNSDRAITPFPLISSNLSNYIEFVQNKHSYSTIRRRVSALRRINTLLGFEDGTHTEEVYLAIRRAKRSKCLDQKQTVGINHDSLVKMIDAQPETLVCVRNRALLSLGYDFLARRSELVAIRS